MSKPLQYFILLVSIVSILFSVYVIISGHKFFDSLGGILIGVALLAALYFDKKRNKTENS